MFLSTQLNGFAKSTQKVGAKAKTEATGTAAKEKASENASKFWRIKCDKNGVWWFVSPEGQQEFLNTVTTVHPAQESREKNGVGYRSTDWSGSRNAQSMRRWAEKTTRRISQAGFKGIGAWSDPALLAWGLPMTRDLNLWSCVSGGPDIFAPEWETAIYATTKGQVEKLKNSTNLVGYYTDNEIYWGPESVGPQVYFNTRKATDPNRLEVLKVIRSCWPSIDQLNQDWKTSFAGWTQFESQKELPTGIPQSIEERLNDSWLEHLCLRYFKITSAAIRKYDPNHLILGVRYMGYASPYVVRASRGLTDAQSINIYHEDAKFDRAMMDMIHRESGQPIIISEYAFHALDGRSGNLNKCKFPALVENQEARAKGYKLFTSRMARIPYIIGADWFQWNDEPPAGRKDGEDVNFGIVDIHDKFYEQMVQAIQETTPILNSLHSQSFLPTGSDMWRQEKQKETK